MRPEKLRVAAFSLLLATLTATAGADALPAGWVGRWDVTLHTPGKDLPTWLEISDTATGPRVRMVGRWGNARYLPTATFAGGKLH